MKTFDDLKFKPHKLVKNCGQATICFENEYGVSVIYGMEFYSTGIGSYEVAITYKGELTFDTSITSDVIGYQSKEQVTEIMKKVQQL